MPTINQLVRQGRTSSEKKSTAPALGKGMNSLKKSCYRCKFAAEKRRVHFCKDSYSEKA